MGCWLEPYPGDVPELPPGPHARYGPGEAATVAFVAAVQHLPPAQRAALLLRDVLGFCAEEVAGMLGMPAAMVEAELRRARLAMADRMPPGRPPPPAPLSEAERSLAGRFAAAFESGDVDGVSRLLTEDAWLTVPSSVLEYHGAEAISGFLRDLVRWHGGRGCRLVPVRANGQPAFGCYLQDPDTRLCRAHGLIVPALAGDRIRAITRITDNEVLPRLGLPPVLPDTE